MGLNHNYNNKNYFSSNYSESQPEEPEQKIQYRSPTVCLDVTEEPRFQNERNGSLDQSDFEYVQKQLFGGTDMAETLTARHNSSVHGMSSATVQLQRLSLPRDAVVAGAGAAGAAGAARGVGGEGSSGRVLDDQSDAASPIPVRTTSTTAHRTMLSPSGFTLISPAKLPPPRDALVTGSSGTASALAPGSPSVGGSSGGYMNSPRLRRYRSKSEETGSRHSELHLADSSTHSHSHAVAAALHLPLLGLC
mmetsp:Transcript_89670/g.175492  ORF Transcript_89670/g.175492 Transcript_89670/m.175492 type:complete len:249 (-) Transcript_89670:488-1234(-)